METPLKALAPDLWIADRPLRFMGLKVGTRMTVVRMANGGLWVHSPVALTPATLGELQALGPVQFIVAPNRLHHLFLSDYLKVFPQARAYAAPGLSEKRPDLKFHGVLGDKPDPAWAGQIDQRPILAFRYLNEVVFFHRATKTLILTDLISHFNEKSPLGIRWVARLLGFYRKFGMPPAFKKRIRQRPELRDSLRSLFDWDFRRLIFAHGELVEGKNSEELRQSLRAAWGL